MHLGINNDKVWQPLQKGAEIALELIKHNRVVIDLDGESPAIESTALPQLFDFLESQGIDLKNITVETGNPIEKYDKIVVRHFPQCFYEIWLFQQHIDDIPTTKNIRYHFGNFVSRTSVPRLIIASHLYTNYQSQTLQTFHYDWRSDYHKTHLDLDGLLHIYGPNSAEFDEAIALLKNSPVLKEEIDTYPILHFDEQGKTNNLINICQWYQDIFVDVICETWYTGNNFYITEKFWRAVATKTPFIIQGSQHIVRNLRRLGFRTFDEFWDEGYSEDPYPYNISVIKQVIEHLSKKSITELEQMYAQMDEILTWNRNVFLDIRPEDIEKRLTK